jgi:CDP-glycerol glycerophosphotransferase
MHPVNKINLEFKNSRNSDRIKFLESNMEINDKINNFNILISDYSGIYIDYLLTNQPIIFAPFDYDEYISHETKLYYNYDDVTPGPKCKDWNEVLVWIEKFKNDPTLYAEERKILKDKFHKYQDGNNCERVYNEIIKLDK